MKHSLFDLFKIGVGPSSSHTMGPMRAAHRFVDQLGAAGLLQPLCALQVELYGSLAHTGKGHGTDRAILLGLSGETPEGVDPSRIDELVEKIRTSRQLSLPGRGPLAFDEAKNLVFHYDRMYPQAEVVSHANGMRFSAFDRDGGLMKSEIFFSIGGGFIVTERELMQPPTASDGPTVPYPFNSADELLARAADAALTLPQLMMLNECSLGAKSQQEVSQGILRLWSTMQACMDRGMKTEGILPGGLKVRRRAAPLAAKLQARGANGIKADPLAPLDWITVYAMAVNEENAAGGRVVTAPTNGAAGLVPAVGRYYVDFVEDADEQGIIRYLLTAAAIGILYKENASISGAEVGCQGEVGVACSMAAAGLVSALHDPSTTTLSVTELNNRIEHAAEIGMEHHLGMTCDPIGGLVQVPCIERNAVGAIKAVNACRMALNESEGHKLSLDQVIRTMYQTGLDMQARYKETSLAGLALNVIEC